jgi:hypothetical protein
VGVRLEKTLDKILIMGNHRRETNESESMGFSVLCDVIKVILYSFDVDEIKDVEFWNRFREAQPSPNRRGSAIANDHL